MANGSNLRRNDQVEVTIGKDKGRVGKILKVKSDNRAVVEKVNMIKRHTKPSMANQQGGIIEKEAPIHISNLMLICPKCSKTVGSAKRLWRTDPRCESAKNAENR